MITDAIINCFLKVAKYVLNLIPDFAIDGVSTMNEWLANIINVIIKFFGSVFYFLPKTLTLVLIAASVSILIITLAWSIIKFIISFIPLSIGDE